MEIIAKEIINSKNSKNESEYIIYVIINETRVEAYTEFGIDNTRKKIKELKLLNTNGK